MNATQVIDQLLSTRRIPTGDPMAVLGGCRDVVVYGAGRAGRDVARLLASKGKAPLGFLDARAAPGQELDGLPVHRWGGPLPASWDPSRTAAAIGIYNATAEILPIERQLREAGFGRVVTFVELHRHFPAEMGDRFWLTDLRWYDDKAPLLARALQLMDDDRGRAAFLALLKFRFTGDHRELQPLDGPPQYFGGGAPPLRTPVRLVDGGAFDGDTLQALFAATDRVEAVACFEPDEVNYRKLVGCCERFRAVSRAPIAALPLGLWSSGAQLRFHVDGTGSGVSAAGEQVISCVRLDDALPAFHPTLVKLDIEGAELDALEGARRTLAEARPDLAVSAYHRPGDIWTLPIYLHELGLGYRTTLRLHCDSGLEAVFYARAGGP
jgi:FkbM family methyltransferase